MTDSVGRVLKTLAQRIDEQQGQIHVEGPLPIIDGNPAQIDRLLQNLLANSLKYHAPDTPPQIWVSGGEADGRVTVSLRDNGVGIAPKDHGRVFEIFQRLVPRSNDDGTGIGLAACRKIVEHHDGTITLISEEGKGATFTLSFPRRVEAA